MSCRPATLHSWHPARRNSRPRYRAFVPTCRASIGQPFTASLTRALRGSSATISLVALRLIEFSVASNPHGVTVWRKLVGWVERFAKPIIFSEIDGYRARGWACPASVTVTVHSINLSLFRVHPAAWPDQLSALSPSFLSTLNVIASEAKQSIAQQARKQ